MPEKILIADYDLFTAVGGGQTVYQNIIRKRPKDQFYYFSTVDTLDLELPPNVFAIPFRREFIIYNPDIPENQAHFFWVYREIIDMARSILQAMGEFSFDVVDVPDYSQRGLFIREVFATHGIEIGKVALALHGRLSTAFRYGWTWTDDPRRMFAEMRVREHLQYRAADCRYTFSHHYGQEWKRLTGTSYNFFDPLTSVREPQLRLSDREDRPADILFLGRKEKRKGPDIFLDLAWWLPREKFRDIIMIGDDGTNHQGKGGTDILANMARLRGISPQIFKSKSQLELQKLSHQKVVAFIPSRIDQFNLVALELLRDGCPTVISRHTGVSYYLDVVAPELSWLVADLKCDRAAAAPMEKILDDYDGSRERIVDAVRKRLLEVDWNTIQRIYDPSPSVDWEAKKAVRDLADRFSLFSVRRSTEVVKTPLSFFGSLISFVERRLRAIDRSRAGVKFNDLWDSLSRGINSQWNRIFKKFYLEGQALLQLNLLRRSKEIRNRLLLWGERTKKERKEKIAHLSSLAGQWKVDRVRYFRELIRLERIAGNDLLAATYGLRIIRWLGRDEFRLLPFIKEQLLRHGYEREVEAADAMYSDPKRIESASREFLDEQWSRHKTKPDVEHKVLDDRRGKKNPRISIIVSLYNAADKLPTFISMLRQQDMVRSGDAEIVLIDGGSPGDEYKVFQEIWKEKKLSAVFASAKARETIQASWNRGIKLARGEYLTFLGVDEGLRPGALAILAHELDEDPTVDWVMADSIVTSVSTAGVFDSDVMKYDRAGYRQDWHYLDTTFLSYVAGMYRRSVHDRCGYYDETFRAAGDTEFKNRVLPHINSKHIPKLLGVFNNYPEGQTTNNPRAEIEDLRAWYLHRTFAGVSYAFDKRPTADALALLNDTFGYRKCYTTHTSTDLDLAGNLAAYIVRRPGGKAFVNRKKKIEKLLRIYRSLELLPNRHSSILDSAAFLRDWVRIRQFRKKHQRAFGLNKLPAHSLFNDNRHEQHWWSWSR